MLEQGARPAAYCFVDFYDNQPIWGSEDLVWKPGEKPVMAAKAISEMYNTYKEYLCLQYAFIKKHEKLEEGVFKISYSNGTYVIVDYNKNEYSVNAATE